MKYLRMSGIALTLNLLLTFTIEGRDFNGAGATGLRFGLSWMRFDLGYEFTADSDGIVAAPALDLSYLDKSGLGIDLSAAAFREPDAYYSFGGGTISTGILYRIPNSALLLKGGWTHFGGGDGDGGTTKAGGPYLGLATMLRTYKHLGIRSFLGEYVLIS